MAHFSYDDMMGDIYRSSQNIKNVLYHTYFRNAGYKMKFYKTILSADNF